MDALAFDVEDKHLVRVLLTPESQFLGERLVSVRCEHHVDCLTLSWLQCSMVRPHLEAVALVVLSVGRSRHGRRVSLNSFLREGPVTGDFLVVLEADLHRFASVDANAIEVESLGGQDQLGDSDVGHEVDGVLGTVLDVDRDRVLLLAELRGLPCREHHIEVLTGVREEVGYFVRLDVEAGRVQSLLSEVERYLHLAGIGQAERPLGRLADDHVAEVADVRSNVHSLVIQGRNRARCCHLSHALSRQSCFSSEC